MKKTPNRIESMVSESRVKQHIFEPSMRKIWTVVGKEKEYWLDPELDFCSCAGFYFANIVKQTRCYHLDLVVQAIKDDKVDIVKFSDDEYEDFLSGIIADL